MTHEEAEARKHWRGRDAVVLVREKDGRPQYRISPRALNHPGDVPLGGFLSNWCTTPERAWRAASCRLGHRVYDSDFGEGF